MAEGGLEEGVGEVTGRAAQLAALRRAVVEAEAEAVAGARLGELADRLKVLGARAAKLRARRVAIEEAEASIRAEAAELRAERGRRVAELMALGAPAVLVARSARLSLARVRMLGDQAKRAPAGGGAATDSTEPAP